MRCPAKCRGTLKQAALATNRVPGRADPRPRLQPEWPNKPHQDPPPQQTLHCRCDALIPPLGTSPGQSSISSSRQTGKCLAVLPRSASSRTVRGVGQPPTAGSTNPIAQHSRRPRRWSLPPLQQGNPHSRGLCHPAVALDSPPIAIAFRIGAGNQSAVRSAAGPQQHHGKGLVAIPGPAVCKQPRRAPHRRNRQQAGTVGHSPLMVHPGGRRAAEGLSFLKRRQRLRA